MYGFLCSLNVLKQNMFDKIMNKIEDVQILLIY